MAEEMVKRRSTPEECLKVALLKEGEAI